MARHLDLTALPDSVARFAQAEVAAGHYASIEEVLAAGVEALRERAAAADRGEFAEETAAEMLARVRARVERSGP